MRLALLPLLALLTSCAINDGVEVYVDGGLTAWESSEVRRAANDWNARTMHPIRFGGDDDSEWIVLKAESPDPYLGRAERRRRIIRIATATPPDQIYAVALHELGHAIGLGHTSRGVMDPAKQTIEFSEEDMVACREAGACE
jgi:hypothetical protein